MARPVKIVSVREDKTLELHEDALESVLLQDQFKDLPVAVVSVAGKYRQGKSFLLGFFLRYLQKQGCEGWLQESDVLTGGFEWKASPNKVTTGIFIWSEPLIVTVHGNKRVAVLLMDTQGTDDTSTDVAQDVAIFALSALLSSALVFNVKDVGKHDMDSLKLFLGYGVLATKQSQTRSGKPFQALHFLVRDWTNPNTNEFGLMGGNAYLNLVTDQVAGLREELYSTFGQVSCFLMPHPGMKVAGDAFKGKVKDVDDDFLVNIRKFVPLVLGSGHLVVKEDIGRRITVGELLAIFKEYFIFFADGKCPIPETLFEGNRTKSYIHAMTVAKEKFDTAIISFDPSTYVNCLDIKLQSAEDAAVKAFLDTGKLGCSPELDQKYLAQLAEYTGGKADALKKINIAKKQIIELENQMAMEHERANEEIRQIKEEIGQMKENEEQLKQERQKDLAHMEDRLKLERLEKETSLLLLRIEHDNSIKTLLESQRESNEKLKKTMEAMIELATRPPPRPPSPPCSIQ